MDLVTSYKEKMALFRVKDLKDVLSELGISKQGKKQDLVERILAIISDDRVSGMWSKKNYVKKQDVTQLVDNVHRKLRTSGSTELTSKSQNVSNVTADTTSNEEVEDSYPIEKVRCPCGSVLQTESMIKCEDKKCNVWQHVGCVIIPEKPMEGIQPTPPTTFYCQLCRLARSDPFMVALAHPLYPVKLTTASIPTDGASLQTVEKTFQLTKADMGLLIKLGYEIQAWCMLLNDKVSFRMHWPLYADLQVNGMPLRAINRPGSQLLGANGRDDGPVITLYIHEGSNRISLTGCDARVFCLGVRIVRRRTVKQILDLIPGESAGERFEDALVRVCRCVGGGPATENADCDSDLEVVSDSIPVNLRCPMSGSRMKIAGRFKPCAHMGCFDLEVFVQMNQRSRKWQCPICLKNYSLEAVIIDPYFTRITSKMRDCGEDVTEVEVKPDGSWRVKAEADQKSLGQLGQWHLPDGALFAPMEVESKHKPEASKQDKHEGGSAGHNTGLKVGLKLGLKKNKNGVWEVSKHESSHSLNGHAKNDSNQVPSIKKDGGGHFGHSTTNVADFGSLPPNTDPGANLNPPASGGVVADVVLLSDSDDETENRVSSGPAYNEVVPQAEDVGPFNNDDEFGLQFWSLPSVSQAGPGFEFFTDDKVHHGLGGPTSLDDFTLPNEIGLNAACPDSSLYESNLDISNGLVENPLAFAHTDPSLQLYFSNTAVDSSLYESNLDQAVSTVSNGLKVNDWASLQLGGNGGSDGGVSHEPPSEDGGKSSKTRCREMYDNLFSFPRQKRSASSVRPQLSISSPTDSGSDR
ncbi:E3 SUMO-protein ligase SIZ1-like [Bidens hawaiensis]|uniref:E3 SUMO-protein ligase SIZ1-like n=1 Tax=Bidens hawaiensis TaxID=980011 RepID=UPI004049CBEF